MLLSKKEQKARMIIAEFDRQTMRIDDFLHTEFKTPQWYFNEIHRIVHNKGLISTDDYKGGLDKANSLFSQLVQEFGRSISVLGRIKETLTKKLVKQLYKDIHRLIIAQYKQEKRHLALRNKVDLICYKIGINTLEKQLREYPTGNVLDKFLEQLEINSEDRIRADDIISFEELNREVEEEEQKQIEQKEDESTEKKEKKKKKTPKKKGKRK